MGGLFPQKNDWGLDDPAHEPILAGTAKLWPGATNYQARYDRLDQRLAEIGRRQLEQEQKASRTNFLTGRFSQAELERVNRGPDHVLSEVERRWNEIRDSDLWASFSHGQDNTTWNVLMDQRLDMDIANEEARQAGVGIFFHPYFQRFGASVKNRVLTPSLIPRAQKEKLEASMAARPLDELLTMRPEAGPMWSHLSEVQKRGTFMSKATFEVLLRHRQRYDEEMRKTENGKFGFVAKLVDQYDPVATTITAAGTTVGTAAGTLLGGPVGGTAGGSVGGAVGGVVGGKAKRAISRAYLERIGVKDPRKREWDTPADVLKDAAVGATGHVGNIARATIEIVKDDLTRLEQKRKSGGHH